MPLASKFCRYYKCNIKGEEEELLCPDGLVFDIKGEYCNYPSKVNCGNRTELRKRKNIYKF